MLAEGVCFGEFLEKALDAYEREAGERNGGNCVPTRIT
jgi:hypothetical protein